MDKLVVKGGARLSGRVEISGSKNSALPILAATLLTPEKCVIKNVPDLSDIRFMLEILRQLGAEVTFEAGVVTTRAEKVISEVPYDLVRKMRASICVLGPILARNGHATISEPGGCSIGDRPIDIHLKGLAELGAPSHSEGGNVHIPKSELIGKEIFLGGRFGSTVLGTDNVMMAATRAKGVTTIESAACEPEVRDLADFLRKMGAKIVGHGTRRVEIEGVSGLGGCEHTVIPDRIEAGTYMVAALITQGDVFLAGADGDHLVNVVDRMKSCGANIKCSGEGIQVSTARKLSSIDLVTETYPGFPTDMQAQLCALMSVTPGISAITEKIFPSRFMHVSELRRMGARIDLEGATAILHGVDHLSGAPVMASDLRASAALVLAGLVAQGTTEVNRVYHIDRGYEHIDEKLRRIGANIERGAVKQTKRRIVYPGTFDPITYGHVDVVGRALQLFDEVVLAIAADSTKKPLFSIEERTALAEKALSEFGAKVRITPFNGLLIDFVKKEKSRAILRGLRAISDFEFEFQMALMNRKLNDSIETLFLMPRGAYTYLSSTIIKEIGRLGGDLSAFVPEAVAKALREKYNVREMTFSPALVTEQHPLDIREQIPAQVLALEDSTAQATQPVDVEVTVQKDEDTFVVTGWARTTLLLRCARDGEMFPQKVRATVEHVFEAPHPAQIDLTPSIREDILLEIPLNAACQLKEGNRCPVTNEVIKPRKELPEAIVPPKDVWAELSKLEPSKPKVRKSKPKK